MVSEKVPGGNESPDHVSPNNVSSGNASTGRAPFDRIIRRRVDVVVIAVSTGGPNALAELMQELPADLPVPVLIVQHMPPTFTQLLSERLDAICCLPVSQAASGTVVAPTHAWMAPGDFHMEVRKAAEQIKIRIHQGPPENSCRPSADVLFRSAADVYGPHVLAVVLTGMGQDGFRGCQRIREAGGQVFVQDEASSVVWGMPGFVANAGLADKVLPLTQLGKAIVQSVASHRPTWIAGAPSGSGGSGTLSRPE